AEPTAQPERRAQYILTFAVALAGFTQPGVYTVCAFASALPGVNAPLVSTIEAIHGRTRVWHSTGAIAAASTVDTSRPFFCCCASWTATLNVSLREHCTVPVT